MNRTINIYLTQDQRKELQKIMAKYHVSTTTICDKITYYTYKYIIHSKRDNKELMRNYFQKTTGKKTSIKIPKCIKENQIIADALKGKESMYISNAMFLYLEKTIKTWLTDQAQLEFYACINRDLQQAKEQFYNYNNFVRSTRRAIRENKDYYKRAIEQQETKGAK